MKVPHMFSPQAKERSLWRRGIAAISSHTGMMVIGAIMLGAVYVFPKIGVSVPEQSRRVLYGLFIALHVPMVFGMHKHRDTNDGTENSSVKSVPATSEASPEIGLNGSAE